jgi:tetratricopeptide (TPR) repeat protein
VQFPRVSVGLALFALTALLSGCVTVTNEAPPPEPGALAESHRNLGIDHVINGRVAFGIRELRDAARLVDDDAVTHLWLGEAYYRRARFEDALLHTERSLELDPENHETSLNLARFYIHFERFDEAIATSTGLADDPTFPSPWRALTNRGWAQLKLRRFSDARASFTEALDFNRYYWPASLNLGILAQAEGQHRQSLGYFATVLEAKAGDRAQAEANYRIAESYVSLGERARAMYHLGIAIEKTPDGRWGKQSQEYLARLQ